MDVPGRRHAGPWLPVALARSAGAAAPPSVEVSGERGPPSRGFAAAVEGEALLDEVGPCAAASGHERAKAEPPSVGSRRRSARGVAPGAPELRRAQLLGGAGAAARHERRRAARASRPRAHALVAADAPTRADARTGEAPQEIRVIESVGWTGRRRRPPPRRGRARPRRRLDHDRGRRPSPSENLLPLRARAPPLHVFRSGWRRARRSPPGTPGTRSRRRRTGTPLDEPQGRVWIALVACRR